MAKNLYSILGVPKSASEAEIKKAFRALAKELHPDRNPGDAAAEARFKEVSRANDVLSDKKKRALYDEFGDVGLREGFDPAYARRPAGAGFGGGGVDFSDIFAGARARAGGGFSFNVEDLFGGAGRSADAAQERRASSDYESELSVAFLDALRGVETEVVFTPHGAPEPKRLRVKIPAGARDGQKMRLRGQGRAGRGDLILTIRVKSHSKVWFEGDDLHVRVPITPLESYRGAKVEVSTPAGQVQLQVPAGAQSGAKLRLRSKGAPTKSGHGDLIAHLEVRLPKKRSDAIEALLETLEGDFAEDVRGKLPDLA